MLVTPKILRIYIVLAVLSLFATLWLPYVGEEAIYAISSYEMWYSHSHLINTIYGDFYGRPPLYNWLAIPLAKFLGWQNILVALRFVSAFATLLTMVAVSWFVQRLTKNRHFALLCAAIYLTGDLLFVRGWLAYADPLLSFFIFTAIAFLWLGTEEKRNDFFLLAIIFLSGGFLVKALSPYWFYGLAGLVLLIFHPNRRFLLRPRSVAIHVFALTIPFIWAALSDPLYLVFMWNEAANTAFTPTFTKYIYQITIAQPIMLLVNLLPFSLIALFFYFRDVKSQQKTDYKFFVKIAFWIALLNFAVCWFAPRWPEPRYYMPVFPLMAMCMAYVIWNARESAKTVAAYGLVAALVAKAIFVGLYYHHYDHARQQTVTIAKDIEQTVGNAPLAVNLLTVESAPVEKVAIYLNIHRYPKPPLLSNFGIVRQKGITYNSSPNPVCHGVYVVGQDPMREDRLIKQYLTGKHRVSLSCRK